VVRSKVAALIASLILATQALAGPEPSLLLFVGAASKPPTEEAIGAFEKQAGTGVDAIYGGSGYVLSQMVLAGRGDVYFPGSSDYMAKAKRENRVDPTTERTVVYLVPAINVRRGNPKGIRSLKDLTRPGLRVAMANPASVCVGVYAVETVERNLDRKEKALLRRNIVNFTESCEKTATAVSLGAVDAVLGWSVFEHWDPKRIETVKLKPAEITRVGYIPVAVARCSNSPERAKAFISFLTSAEGRRIFASHHYFLTPEEAFAYIGEKKPVGGEYTVPSEWLVK